MGSEKSRAPGEMTRNKENRRLLPLAAVAGAAVCSLLLFLFASSKTALIFIVDWSLEHWKIEQDPFPKRTFLPFPPSRCACDRAERVLSRPLAGR